SQFYALCQELPPAVHLLTLASWGRRVLLQCLQHQLTIREDTHHSLISPVILDFRGLFSTFTITHLQETMLVASQARDRVSRLQWTARWCGLA
ncbi:lysosomal alpha-mannosidase-like, partial [Trichechus manatus latirostris]|uniref:Lysosomal alpha-mannosidase-like n=1 Tax=Trichechus manatus latirostris TaxID=127582 RepID=A0A2Y9QMW5_TRIMA